MGGLNVYFLISRSGGCNKKYRIKTPDSKWLAVLATRVYGLAMIRLGGD